MRLGAAVRFGAAVSIGASVLCVAPCAFAEDTATPRASDLSRRSGTTQTKDAIALGHQGLHALDAGDFAAAFELFAGAEALAHSPVFLLHQARAAWNLGRWELALNLYDACTSEKLDANSPPPWRETVETASAEKARLVAVMPSLRVSWASDFAQPIQMKIERLDSVDPKQAYDATEVMQKDAWLHLDAGEYLVILEDAQRRKEAQRVVLEPRRPVRLHFGLSKPQLTRDVQLHPSQPRRGTPNELKMAAYVAWGSGVGLLTFGGVAGGVALGLAAAVRANCEEDICPSEEQERAQAALRWGNLATAGIVSGLVGVGAGTMCWVWDRKRQAKLRLASSGAVLQLEGTF